MGDILNSNMRLIQWPDHFTAPMTGYSIKRSSHFGGIEWDVKKREIVLNNLTAITQKQTRLEFVFQIECHLSDDTRPSEAEWMAFIRKTENDVAAFISTEARYRNAFVVPIPEHADEVGLHYLLNEIFAPSF